MFEEIKDKILKISSPQQIVRNHQVNLQTSQTKLLEIKKNNKSKNPMFRLNRLHSIEERLMRKNNHLSRCRTDIQNSILNQH